MKKILALVTIACFIFGCSRDKMIEITHFDYSVDTIMTNTHHFELDKGRLWSTRSIVDGGCFVVDSNVKYYRIISQ